MLDLFLYEETNGEFLLKISEISTIKCLKHFEAKIPLNITVFGATCYRNFGYATEEDIPKVKTVKELIDFLETEYDVGLIELELELEGIGKISSQDDSEINFIFNSRTFCIEYLQKLIPVKCSGLIISTLLDNPGVYVSRDRFGKTEEYSKSYLSH